VHLLACAIGLSTLFADQKIESFWGTNGFCWEDEIVGTLLDGRDKFKCVNEWRQYLTAFYYVLSCVFAFDGSIALAGGPGMRYFANAADGDRDLFQVHETLTFLVVTWLGSLLSLYITGAFVSVVSGDNLSISEEVTRFCKRYGVENAKRRELQKYFETLSSLEHMVPKPNLFLRITPTMQWQLLLDIHGQWLTALPFFSFLYDMPAVHLHGGPVGNDVPTGDQTHVLCAIALAMQPMLLIPHETVKHSTLFVVIKGLALEVYTKKVLRDGDSGGSLSMIIGLTEADKFKGLTMTSAIHITHDMLMELLETNPRLNAPFRRVRLWARFKILLRHIRRTANMRRVLMAEAMNRTETPAEKADQGSHRSCVSP